MTSRLAIVAAFCLYGGVCCAAISQMDAEDAVRRRVVQRGLRVGLDAETGTYTVIASAAKSGIEDGSPASCAQRVACFRLAELKAIHQILNMRGQTMAGQTAVQRGHVDDAAVKTVRTFVETLSESDMDGCVVVDACELTDGTSRAVAVAMTWSAELERCARASAGGSIRPAAAWIEELKTYLANWGDGLPPPTVAFVDSAGFFHRLGVGVAALGGASPLERNAAARLADIWARKNLQLALFGRVAMRKKAELMKTSSRREELQGLASAYEALGEVAAEGPLPMGSLSILESVMMDSSSSGKLLVVVYGVKTQRTASGVAVPIQPGRLEGTSGVMVFNPKTGKFEKQ